MIENKNPLCARLFLQEFFNLFVVNLLDFGFVREVLFHARVLHELEARCIEGQTILFFLASCVVDYDRLSVLPQIVWFLTSWGFVRIQIRCARASRAVVVQVGR